MFLPAILGEPLTVTARLVSSLLARIFRVAGFGTVIQRKITCPGQRMQVRLLPVPPR